MLSIVIDDMGFMRSGTERAVALPGPLTMSWFPFAPHLPTQVAALTNGLSAGVELAKDEQREGTVALALTGRVWVHCDATHGAIHPGDGGVRDHKYGHKQGQHVRSPIIFLSSLKDASIMRFARFQKPDV